MFLLLADKLFFIFLLLLPFFNQNEQWRGEEDRGICPKKHSGSEHQGEIFGRFRTEEEKGQQNYYHRKRSENGSHIRLIQALADSIAETVFKSISQILSDSIENNYSIGH